VLQEEAGGVAIQDYRHHCQASPHGQLLTHRKTGALTHQNLGFRLAPKISQIWMVWCWKRTNVEVLQFCISMSWSRLWSRNRWFCGSQVPVPDSILRFLGSKRKNTKTNGAITKHLSQESCNPSLL
jgi:hypothetical protein